MWLLFNSVVILGATPQALEGQTETTNLLFFDKAFSPLNSVNSSKLVKINQLRQQHLYLTLLHKIMCVGMQR